jgi:hypothetical protein
MQAGASSREHVAAQTRPEGRPRTCTASSGTWGIDPPSEPARTRRAALPGRSTVLPWRDTGRLLAALLGRVLPTRPPPWSSYGRGGSTSQVLLVGEGVGAGCGGAAGGVPAARRRPLSAGSSLGERGATGAGGGAGGLGALTRPMERPLSGLGDGSRLAVASGGGGGGGGPR